MSVLARAYLSWATICLVWGTTYLAIRISLETLPPGLSAGLRWLTAGILLALGHVATRRPLPRPVQWPGLALLGVLFIVAGNGLVVWAEQWVPSGMTAVLLATTPFWMVGIELFVPRGERPGARTWAGLVVGFGGIVLLVWPDIAAAGSDRLGFVLGVIALQAACLTWSIGSAYSRARHQEHPALAGAAIQMISGGMLLTLVGSATGEWSRLAFGVRSGLAFAYLIFVGSIVAYSAYLYALKHLPISTLSLYSYINPIIAVVLGALVLGEPLGLRTAAAVAVVLVGVALVRSEAAAAPDHKGEAEAEAGA